MPVTIKITEEPSLTAFHGVKFGDVDAVLSGIKRPDGSAGNFDDDWKGFYVADQQLGAIGYATVSDAYADAAMAKGAIVGIAWRYPHECLSVQRLSIKPPPFLEYGLSRRQLTVNKGRSR